MRPTTILKASALQTAVTRANQFHPSWRTEHFANGEHNSSLIPVSVIDVTAAGSVALQCSVKDAGAVYSATASKLSTGRYLITLDAAISITGAEAFPFAASAVTAEVDAISANTVQVRTYTVSSSGTFSLADTDFTLIAYAAKFDDGTPAALAVAFAPGDFPVATRFVAVADAQNDTHDLMLEQHSMRGVHVDRRNPFALGRISYSGSTYSVQPGSIGIIAASKVSSGRCKLEFAATAPTRWLPRITPIGGSVYWYASERAPDHVIIDLFYTGSKPTYALADRSFFVAGWAL